MDFPLTRQIVDHLLALDETGSTNDDLVARASREDLPAFTVLTTTNQTAGRGRLDRSWVTPPGQALAVSVLLKPVRPDGTALSRESYGWIPLLAGLAMTRTVARLTPGHEVRLKWPNDVLIDGLKVCGILGTLLPNGADVVLGAGLNLTIPAAGLPVPTATSLLLNGVAMPAEELADLALAGYLGELRALWTAFLASGGDARGSGIVAAVNAACGTLGSRVRVSLPDDSTIVGTATAIDDEGRVIVAAEPDGREVTVAAGDVTHLRYE